MTIAAALLHGVSVRIVVVNLPPPLLRGKGASQTGKDPTGPRCYASQILQLYALQLPERRADSLHFFLGALALLLDGLERVGKIAEATDGFAI